VVVLLLDQLLMWYLVLLYDQLGIILWPALSVVVSIIILPAYYVVAIFLGLVIIRWLENADPSCKTVTSERFQLILRKENNWQTASILATW
jgi:uncharacterized membrane protein YqjE